MNFENDMYTLITERDTVEETNDSNSIAWEQCLDYGHATLEAVKKRQEYIGDLYGKSWIAKLTVIEE